MTSREHNLKEDAGHQSHLPRNSMWLLREPRGLRREESDVSTSPPNGWVRLVPRRVGICGSDLHIYRGDRMVEPDLCMGHEVTAVVADGNGTRWTPGDRVVVEPNIPCGRCQACVRGVGEACLDKTTLGITHRGGLALVMDAPADYLYGIPPQLSEDVAVFTEPLAVSLHAIRTMGYVGPGADIAIIGGGAQGILLARLLGTHHHIVILENNPHRQELLRSLDPSWDCRPATDDKFMHVFETGGTAGSAELALDLLNPGGTLVIVGLSQDPVCVTPFQIARSAWTIKGSIIYDHRIDFPASLTWLARYGTPSLLPTKTYAFDNVPEAFETFARGETVKAIISMEAYKK